MLVTAGAPTLTCNKRENQFLSTSDTLPAHMSLFVIFLPQSFKEIGVEDHLSLIHGAEAWNIWLCYHLTCGRGSGTGVHLIHLSLVGMGLSLTLSCHPPNPLCLAHFISAWPNNFKSTQLIWTLYGTEGLPMKNHTLLQGNSCVPTGIGN